MKRRTDRHLPQCVYFKHGAYWHVKRGKWSRIGGTLAEALAEYARIHETTKGGMPDLIERVLQHVKPRLAKSTQDQYRHAADVLKAAFVEFAPQQVKSKHVAQVKLKFADRPNMGNRILSFLRVVFQQAVEWQEVDSNPCIGVKRHKEAKRDRLLTADEWGAIYEKADPRLQVIMRLQYLTGQRVTDVLTIKRSQLTDKGIEFKQRKTGAKLTVRWSPELKSAVEDAIALSPVQAVTLLRGRGGAAPNYRTVALQFANAAAAAGVEDARLNDGRAMSATAAKRQGISAQALLGHTTPAHTERYLRDREAPEVDGPSMARKAR